MPGGMQFGVLQVLLFGLLVSAVRVLEVLACNRWHVFRYLGSTLVQFFPSWTFLCVCLSFFLPFFISSFIHSSVLSLLLSSLSLFLLFTRRPLYLSLSLSLSLLSTHLSIYLLY